MYDNELLYSILARFHLFSGNTSTKDTLINLFGNVNVCATVDLPSHLKQLCKYISNQAYTPEYFIEKHTLFPYYRPFLPSDRVEKIVNNMIGSNGKGIHMQAGIMASKIKIPSFLRYCPVCFLESSRINGIAYWNRLHQLPGVLICLRHNTLLLDSSIPFSIKTNKHEFCTLNELTSSATSIQYSENIYNKSLLENLKKVTEQSSWLLKHNLQPVDHRQLKSFYTNKLKEKGLVTISNRIRFQELIPAFIRFYSPDFLEIMGSSISVGMEDTWLHKILRNSHVFSHPLRHLLLLLYLDEHVEILKDLSVPNSVHYFGDGPWPCLNKTANHYEQLVVTECLITRGNKKGKVVGSFKCSCGFIYTRQGPDNSVQNQYKIGTIKEFGEIWEQKLLELSKDSALSQREIARRMGVDSKTIKRYVGKIKSQSIEPVCSEKRTNQPDEKLMQYRTRWLIHIEDYLGESRTELRSRLPAVYTWLYRHDKEWLFKNLPIIQRKVRQGIKMRVDWKKRDEDLAALIMIAIQEILSIENRPIRITLNRVGIKINQLGRLKRNRGRLPKCNEILNKYLETIHEFQIRRIRIAVKRIGKQDDNIAVWRVIRAAGLKSKDVLVHREIIIREIERIQDIPLIKNY